MKKGKTVLLLTLAALLAAKGLGLLPKSREMEELRLVTALAFDGTKVAALTGVRVTESEEAETLAGEGESLAEACSELRTSSARRAYLGQTQQLLLGEGQDTARALEFVLQDRELRLDTLLYIVKGKAGEALEASAPQMSGEAGGQDPRGRTVGETLPPLSRGELAPVPALEPNEDGILAPAGWAVLGPSGVVGFLEGEAALGGDLLLGLGTGRAVALPGGSVELTGIRTGTRDGKLTCTLTGRAVQGDPTAEELERWGETRLRAALAPGWDCWGIGRALGLDGGLALSEVEIRVAGRLVKSGG